MNKKLVTIKSVLDGAVLPVAFMFLAFSFGTGMADYEMYSDGYSAFPIVIAAILCAFELLASFIFGFMWWFDRQVVPQEGKEKVSRCNREYCKAWSNKQCSSGYCNEHCGLYCKCAATTKNKIPERPLCTSAYCTFWRNERCVSGTCNSHCNMYCKCGASADAQPRESWDEFIGDK